MPSSTEKAAETAMEKIQRLLERLSQVSPRTVRFLEKYIRRLPAVKKEIDQQTDAVMEDLRDSLRPYEGEVPVFTQLPQQGRDKTRIVGEMQRIQTLESARWREGLVSGTVYHGDHEFEQFLNEVYALNSHSNPLHSDLFPSSSKFESEIVAMTADMLGASQTKDEICGTVSSGGTESILLAMKTYRDRARKEKGIRNPEIVAPVTAHAAFDKAAEYFGMKITRFPVDENFRADLRALRRALSIDTAVIVGSAPTFPHGAIDPIEEMAALAQKKGIGMHVDACLGGFILPWVEKLGYPVSPFDFRVPGVTSMSADTHKYGFAPKGTSVVLYRGKDLRRYQYFTVTDWPGGLYFSPTFAGSRSGALSAGCWAAMVATGQEGYLAAAKGIMEAAEKVKAAITAIPELYILGKPLWNIAFGSDSLNIYLVMDRMSQHGWNLSGLYKPACVHICLTLRHAQPGIGERFATDLQEAVEYVKTHPEEEGGMAPVYGMAGTLPLRGVVSDLLKKYMDGLYEP